MKPLRYLTLVMLCCLFAHARAQYVTIPDANFAAWLQTNFPLCMNGNDLDTTCSDIQNYYVMDIVNKPITDLTGIEYFHNLTQLRISNCPLTHITAFPENLENIDLSRNALTSLPDFPPIGYSLDVSFNQLTTLPALPPGLTYFYCGDNPLTAVPALPSTVEVMSCADTKITSLPALPASLSWLNCSNTLLTGLPALPADLYKLECRDNDNLTTLPALNNALQILTCGGAPLSALPSPLPDSLKTLYCYRGAFATVPALPAGLINLALDSNFITSVPALPAGLKDLNVDATLITGLPALPASLTSLSCCKNPQLVALPVLPGNLRVLNCYFNRLTSLPALPPALRQLLCYNNLLTSLPQLPDTLTILWCYNNPNLHCLPPLSVINNLHFDGSNISCVPNYGQVTSSTPPLGTKPLCDPFNPNNCQVYWNIQGNAFNDVNGNCVQQSGDANLPLLKINLLKNNALLQQTYTGVYGLYTFDTDTGSYTTTVDTTGVPFNIKCPASRFDSATITLIDSMATGRNFAMQCKPGFDVAAYSLLLLRNLRPAGLATVYTKAGDAALLWGATCNTTNVTGLVTITLSGPVSFVSPAAGALTPVVNGNTLTYTVNNWAAITTTAFNFIIAADTTAQIGQQVCIAMAVSSNGDYNAANNQLSHCFLISNSYDPNDKLVAPPGNISNAAQWLTYTIHFQNTGSAAAENIYVLDTLDAAVDAASFQLLAYSHMPQVQIFNAEHRARFTFANINLPDSLHNEPQSHGSIQYRVKTLPGLNCGTQIGNAAHIYFDFNAPVATNAALNTIYQSAQTNLQNTICLGEPFVFNGQALIATGDYTDTLQGAFACDSIINLHLDVLPAYTQNETATVCNGEAYNWHNRTLTTTGNYTDTLQASSSCDSVINLHLNVLQAAETTESAAACNGEAYSWHNQNFTAQGTYTDTLQTTTGCDSVVILNLEFYSGNTTTLNVTMAQGDSYILPSGEVLTQPGVYYDTLATMYGCDSVIVVNLNVVAGIENIAANATMQLYPNPASDMVLVNLSDNLTGGTLTLSDVTGRALTTIALTAARNQLNIAELSSGVYVVTANRGGIRVVQRLVISH